MSDDRHQEMVRRVVSHLHQERVRKGLSVYRVARMAKVGESTIAKIEKGDQSPTLYILLKIAEAQGTAVAFLFDEFESGREAESSAEGR